MTAKTECNIGAIKASINRSSTADTPIKGDEEELINRYADIIIEFEQRENYLYAQIARRNQGLRLCQKKLALNDKELIRLQNLSKDENNKTNLLKD